jgi:diguanylate cyclase (GGDEF)-like protein
MDKSQAYLEHIQKLLRDDKAPDLEGELANDLLLRQIHDELTVIRNITHAFSGGDFNSEIVTGGFIPGCLKSLQSHLRHLVWQVQMVEKGDFSQKVHFMGEFSGAFNSMVRRLHLSLTKLQKNEESLSDLNNKLRKEAEQIELLKESEARFKYLASRDPLTGILNRRSFIDMVTVALDNAASRHIPCCLAMMDIDHFKLFNDTYGHIAGDKALCHVSRLIEKGLRKNDLIGRYGGEEFIFLLYNADEKMGMKVLERIRKKLSKTPVHLEDGSVTIKASFGLAGDFREDVNEKRYIQKIIDDADTALYAAKMAGRDRVVLFDPELKSREEPVPQDSE